LATIESPMVGTFYAASNPDSSPFVTVGSSVDPDTVVCMIEAMKIFNEIKAECSGTIEKVLVNNGESIEFGQALFIVRPS
ncbi:MAG: acetyl-CoA carboxylase, biotin carboxyl carrier protein, partial [Planctomycetota bacterium]|nr:acetyl-CoA carboxylase, biotin carboxyl carrier protein [Planctomycetota bacterium]